MALSEEEKALILALLTRMSTLGDPRYDNGRRVAEIVADTLNSISSTEEPVRIIHIDAGGRTLETPGIPASIVKLAVYTLELNPQPGGELWYHTYRVSLPEGSQRFYLLYARGDYRVRQALTYIVELAALLHWLKRQSESGGLVVGLKDGPLVQQLAQYLSPRFDLPEKTARSALYYAGLDDKTVNALILESRRAKREGFVSAGALMASILERLYDMAEAGEAYPAGVVEDTSRSSTLLFTLLADTIVDLTLEAARLPSFEKSPAYIASLKANELLGEPLGVDADRLARCLCESPEELMSLGLNMGRAINLLLEALDRALTLKGSLPGLKAVPSKASGGSKGRVEVIRAIVRAFTRSQLLPFSTRDPDLIMAAYYLGTLNSYVTIEFERHELYTSALDAIEAGALSGDNALSMKDEDIKRRIFKVTGGLRARYLVVDPPLRCGEIEDRLNKAGMGALEPCLIAASDTYTYAPPIRLEYYRDPDSPATLAGLVLLEAFLTRYKYPEGVMVADIASRVRYEEALTAKPLAERLIPLRYYIRSWEKRVELM